MTTHCPYALFPHGDLVIPREALAAWVGRRLTNEEIIRLANALANSSVPEAIATIVEAMN